MPRPVRPRRALTWLAIHVRQSSSPRHNSLRKRRPAAASVALPPHPFLSATRGGFPGPVRGDSYSFAAPTCWGIRHVLTQLRIVHQQVAERKCEPQLSGQIFRPRRRPSNGEGAHGLGAWFYDRTNRQSAFRIGGVLPWHLVRTLFIGTPPGAFSRPLKRPDSPSGLSRPAPISWCRRTRGSGP